MIALVNGNSDHEQIECSRFCSDAIDGIMYSLRSNDDSWSTMSEKLKNEHN